MDDRIELDVGRVGKPTGLSQAEPEEGLGPSGFDPSRNTFIMRMTQFNQTWGIKKEPSIGQAAHMLAVFGLELVPASRPMEDGRRANSGPSKGGKARAASLSPERRSEIAKEAAKARWGASDSDGAGE